MAERASQRQTSSLRELVERVLARGGGEDQGARALVEDLVARGRLSRDDADQLLHHLGTGPGLAHRVSDRATELLAAIADQAGLVRERELQELELRVAQLEHRLALLERAADSGEPPAAPPR